MKKIFGWQFWFAFILIVLSVMAYELHYVLFHDARSIFFYLIMDIAFLFLNVLIVALIINRLLEYRAKQVILNHLNMAIGTFFSEIGMDIIKQCITFDQNTDAIREKLAHPSTWKEPDYNKIRMNIVKHESGIDSTAGDLEALKRLLVDKRSFLLSLLQNQNLLEHEAFTDMLWATFHVTDELAHRKTTSNLSEADYKHLAGDIKRMYQLILLCWVDYLKHLARDYPYLYSLAIRTNPFDGQASVELK
jgi:hypothetical protein